MRNMEGLEVSEPIGLNSCSLTTYASTMQNISITKKLAIFPGDARNDYYITIDSGDFTQDRKGKNIEVVMTVRDSHDGSVIPVPTFFFTYFVCYSNNTSWWVCSTQ